MTAEATTTLSVPNHERRREAIRRARKRLLRRAGSPWLTTKLPPPSLGSSPAACGPLALVFQPPAAWFVSLARNVGQLGTRPSTVAWYLTPPDYGHGHPAPPTCDLRWPRHPLPVPLTGLLLDPFTVRAGVGSHTVSRGAEPSHVPISVGLERRTALFAASNGALPIGHHRRGRWGVLRDHAPALPST